jgi:hypothetical protein
MDGVNIVEGDDEAHSSPFDVPLHNYRILLISVNYVCFIYCK